MMRSLPVVLSCLLAVLECVPAAAASELRVENLRCESRANPLGVDSPNPRLSWTLISESRGQHQTAYRVLVASCAAVLARGEGDLWDSGKVDSAQSLHVAYQGKPLSSGLACYWMVRVWDARRTPSEWSETARWEMGLLDRADWEGAWINDGLPNPERTKISTETIRHRSFASRSP